MIGSGQCHRAKATDGGGRESTHISNDGGGPRIGNPRTC